MPCLYKGRKSFCAHREGQLPSNAAQLCSPAMLPAPQAALAHTPLPTQQLPARSQQFTCLYDSHLCHGKVRTSSFTARVGLYHHLKGTSAQDTPALSEPSLSFIVRMLLDVTDFIWSYVSEDQSVISHSSREGLLLATVTVLSTPNQKSCWQVENWDFLN